MPAMFSSDFGGRTADTIAKAVGQGIQSFANYSGQAASRANGVSRQAQINQGTFNQASANNANSIATDRIADQYAFNAAQAAMANNFSQEQFERAMAFNAEEAQKNRDWQERIMSTAYQRAVGDMEKAGLNPILAVTGGGISTGAGSGSAASVSAPSGQAASGGLMQGVSASESSYSGQMEYMGGMLGLLAAAISGLSSAQIAMGQMGDFGVSLGQALKDILDPRVSSPWGGLEWDKDSWSYKLYKKIQGRPDHNTTSGTFGGYINRPTWKNPKS